jgi:hypothetical protein
VSAADVAKATFLAADDAKATVSAADAAKATVPATALKHFLQLPL